MFNFQTSIFYNLQEFIETSPLYRKYYLLFQSLDLSDFSDGNTGVGCTGYSRRAIFRAFIVKHLEEIKTVPRLIEYLENHPVITDLCCFDMRKNLPDESQFYRFLKTTNNSVLEAIHHRINKKLIEENIISRDIFILDSKPVMAATKDNNFKNPNRNTTNKEKKPKRNPSATLTQLYHIAQPTPIKTTDDKFLRALRILNFCAFCIERALVQAQRIVDCPVKWFSFRTISYINSLAVFSCHARGNPNMTG